MDRTRPGFLLSGQLLTVAGWIYTAQATTDCPNILHIDIG